MLAKLTSKYKLPLPKSVTVAFGAAEHFEVEANNGHIVPTAVRIQCGDAERAKHAELDFQEQDTSDAVAWTRRSAANQPARRKWHGRRSRR